MLANSIWIAGLVLELAILLRSLWTRLYLRFPIFYAYLFAVFASSVSLWVIHAEGPKQYAKAYWSWEVVTILLGYGVVMEIMHRTLEDYRGADRLARFLALAMFAVIFGGLTMSLVVHKNPIAISDWAHHFDALERDLRIVQLVFLLITMAVALYYRIELRRNLNGLMLGFGTYIAVSVLSMASRFYFGARFDPIFSELQPVAYLFALGTWVVALWDAVTVRTKSPGPDSDATDDYQKTAAETRKKLKDVRSRFLTAENR
jgi:hypothetical protein